MVSSCSDEVKPRRSAPHNCGATRAEGLSVVRFAGNDPLIVAIGVSDLISKSDTKHSNPNYSSAIRLFVLDHYRSQSGGATSPEIASPIRTLIGSMTGRVKTSKAQAEQMFSDLPSIADVAGFRRHGRKVPIASLRKNSETILGAPQVTASLMGLLDRTALERRLFCDPSSSIEYDAVTNPYCPRRSDNGVYPRAWILAKITDLLPIVSNECPKNFRILG